MSRRRRRAETSAEPPAESGRPTEADRPAGRAILLDIVILAAVFGIAVGVAELAGAANLGVSFGVGQLCFALALIVVLTRE